VPTRKTVDLAKLRKELQRAVEGEDYERAAKLRDQIREAEGT
jgi:protein-arginine kinase activator protein McsA